MIKNYFILGLGTALTAVSFLYFQKSNQVKDMELSLIKSNLAYTERLRETEQTNYNEVINAINEATTRSNEVKRNSIAVNDANDRLQQTITKLNSELNQISETARIDYTTTLSELFRECTTRYIDVAEKADGHVNDIKTREQIFRRVNFDAP